MSAYFRRNLHDSVYKFGQGPLQRAERASGIPFTPSIGIIVGRLAVRSPAAAVGGFQAGTRRLVHLGRRGRDGEKSRHPFFHSFFPKTPVVRFPESFFDGLRTTPSGLMEVDPRFHRGLDMRYMTIVHSAFI